MEANNTPTAAERVAAWADVTTLHDSHTITRQHTVNGVVPLYVADIRALLVENSRLQTCNNAATDSLKAMALHHEQLTAENARLKATVQPEVALLRSIVQDGYLSDSNTGRIHEMLGRIVEAQPATAPMVPMSEYQALQALVTSQGIRLMEYESESDATALPVAVVLDERLTDERIAELAKQVWVDLPDNWFHKEGPIKNAILKFAKMVEASLPVVAVPEGKKP